MCSGGAHTNNILLSGSLREPETKASQIAFTLNLPEYQPFPSSDPHFLRILVALDKEMGLADSTCVWV